MWSHLKACPGRRICFQASVVVGRIQFLAGSWAKGSLLALGWRYSSVPLHMVLSMMQFTALPQLPQSKQIGEHVPKRMLHSLVSELISITCGAFCARTVSKCSPHLRRKWHDGMTVRWQWLLGAYHTWGLKIVVRRVLRKYFIEVKKLLIKRMRFQM